MNDRSKIRQVEKALKTVPSARTNMDIETIMPFLMNLKELRENVEVPINQEDIKTACRNMTLEQYKADETIAEVGTCG